MNIEKEYLDELLTKVRKCTDMKWEIVEYPMSKNIFMRLLTFLYRETTRSKYVLSHQDLTSEDLNAPLVPIDFSIPDWAKYDHQANYHVTADVIAAYLRGVIDGVYIESSTIVYVEYKK